MFFVKFILIIWALLFLTGIVCKILVKHKMLDPNKKYAFKIKNPILQVIFALVIISFIFSLLVFTFVTLPITILLSKLFPNYIEASLRHGLTIRNSKSNIFSMTW